MIKLKRLIDTDAYDSQKYVIVTEKVRNSLTELTKSDGYKSTGLSESLTLENYTLIAEWVSLNKDDVYAYQLHPHFSSWYYFKDRNDVIHEIRLTKGIKERYEVKVWFIDEDGKPNYSPPNIYGNFKYDTAIFNTHIYILINEIIPHFFNPVEDEPLYLPATDKARYRLYKITLNNHLDKTKYTLADLGDNTLSLSPNKKT